MKNIFKRISDWYYAQAEKADEPKNESSVNEPKKVSFKNNTIRLQWTDNGVVFKASAYVVDEDSETPTGPTWIDCVFILASGQVNINLENDKYVNIIGQTETTITDEQLKQLMKPRRIYGNQILNISKVFMCTDW